MIFYLLSSLNFCEFFISCSCRIFNWSMIYLSSSLIVIFVVLLLPVVSIFLVVIEFVFNRLFFVSLIPDGPRFGLVPTYLFLSLFVVVLFLVIFAVLVLLFAIIFAVLVLLFLIMFASLLLYLAVSLFLKITGIHLFQNVASHCF